MTKLSKKNIVFFTSHLHKGGMQRAISNISNALIDYYNIYIVFFETEYPDFKFSGQLVHICTKKKNRFDKFNAVLKYFKRPIYLNKFLKDTKIDVVISFGEVSSLYNIFSFYKCKKIVSVRVSINENFKKGFHSLIVKSFLPLVYNLSDHIILVSADLEKEILPYIIKKKRISIIQNLYPIKKIQEEGNVKINDQYFWLYKKEYIVNIGSLSFQKGQDILVKAFAKSKFYKSGGLLVLVGRGPSELKIKKIVKDLGIENSVIFTGHQSNPFPFIKNAKLFVLSSRYEGFPNILIEAMALGTQVLAFNCPTGPKEILNEDLSVCLVNGCNEHSLCEFIDNSPKLPEEQLIQRASCFDESLIVKKWQEAIENNIDE